MAAMVKSCVPETTLVKTILTHLHSHAGKEHPHAA